MGNSPNSEVKEADLFDQNGNFMQNGWVAQIPCPSDHIRNTVVEKLQNEYTTVHKITGTPKSGGFVLAMLANKALSDEIISEAEEIRDHERQQHGLKPYTSNSNKPNTKNNSKTDNDQPRYFQ